MGNKAQDRMIQLARLRNDTETQQGISKQTNQGLIIEQAHTFMEQTNDITGAETWKTKIIVHKEYRTNTSSVHHAEFDMEIFLGQKDLSESCFFVI